MIKKASSYLFLAHESRQPVSKLFTAKTLSRNKAPLILLSGTCVAANLGMAYYQNNMFQDMHMLFSSTNGGSGNNGGNNNGPSSSGGNNGGDGSIASANGEKKEEEKIHVNRYID
jgi:uncharacterized membrane protein YgcG